MDWQGWTAAHVSQLQLHHAAWHADFSTERPALGSDCDCSVSQPERSAKPGSNAEPAALRLARRSEGEGTY